MESRIRVSGLRENSMKTNLVLYIVIWVFSLLAQPSFCEGKEIQLPHFTLHSSQKPIVIVTASYNNAEWYKRNLDSVFMQDYDNYHLIYIDDNSTDHTYELVEAYIQEKGMQNRVTLIHNEERIGALANQYKAIHACDDATICAILDGDDFLASEQVLQILNDAYADGNTWLTYGQIQEWPSNYGGCKEMPAYFEILNIFREKISWPYFPTHLRTFYAGLFKHIHIEDLQYRGTFFPMCADLAVEIPLLELGRGHIKFIPQVLVIYNMSNPINDNKVNEALQMECNREIRKRKKYDKAISPF